MADTKLSRLTGIPVMAFAVDRQKHFIEKPFIPGARSPATQPIRVVLPELLTPPTDGFVGDVDAPFQEELLHVAIAQGEAIIEPDAMTDNVAREAVVFVSLGVSGRSHIGCLSGMRWVMDPR
jgi:hypothetical protein